MNLQKRIELLIRLGQYILSQETSWQQAKSSAERANNWFTHEFVEKASRAIATQFLDEEKLHRFVNEYEIPQMNPHPVKVGLVMAGNIPLVGFHDWLCVFLSGHRAVIKASSKDEILITHLLETIAQWDPAFRNEFVIAPMLKGCDAYIATGSNNSSRYFDYYFSKYPHIIRRNRTSIAILTGEETPEELARLADDVHLYFGFGCRNVTKIYVPDHYDFVPLLETSRKYAYFNDHNKYKNNYDYQLAIHIMNNHYYMTNGTLLLIKNPSFFSPISQLNYEFYPANESPAQNLLHHPDLQCIVGKAHIPFGKTQEPSLTSYADGVDTMRFLLQPLEK